MFWLIFIQQQQTTKTPTNQHKRNEPHHNNNISSINNNIKKCNNKSILDLKAVYPLQKIREQNYKHKRKIIIIGAGISGLSAARECMNYGYDVVVLEVK